MNGAGATTTVAAGATLTVSGAAPKLLNERTLSTSGTIAYAGTGYLSIGWGATFVNQAGGIFDAQTATGTLAVRLSGAGCTPAGLLSVTGTAVLAGALTVNEVNSCVLAPGQSRTGALIYGARTGAFTSAAAGYSPTFGATQLTLTKS